MIGITSGVQPLGDLIDVPTDGGQSLVHLFYVGGVGVDDISVNRHLAEICADSLCGEKLHLLFYQGSFFRCHGAAKDDRPLAVRHSVFLRFYKGLGLSQQAFLHFRARDLKMQKSASVATLAVLAILSLSSRIPSFSLYPYYNSEGVKWPLS
jgi:hypothetical protein